MFILSIIPITKSISKEILTYFSKEPAKVGSLVKIPLRLKTTHGLVIESKLVIEKKSEIKNYSYNLRKIERIKSSDFLLPDFIKATTLLSDYYATSTGIVLSALIPKSILESKEDLNQSNTQEENEEIIEKEKQTECQIEIPEMSEKKELLSEILTVQSDQEERYATYKSYIREEFARKNSVFFCLPSIEDIKEAKNSLEKGIEKYTFIFHNGLPKKNIIENWKNALNIDHPVLIISTGSFLSIPRSDIKTIILDKESSRGYMMQTRPYLDIRKACEFVCRKMGRKLLIGDLMLRVESIFKAKNDEYAELSALKFRSISTAETILVDTRTSKDQTKKDFEILSKDLKNLITKNKEENSNMFLFVSRKGLSPITVCSDCGDTVLCRNCLAPVVLYERKNHDTENFFLCHKCGTKRGAGELCKRCGSWKLTSLGIGIESVAREIDKNLENQKVFIMDKDHVKTHKQASKIADDFYNSPGAIMIGTEMALTYLSKKIPVTAVVSLDALFGVPDFRMNEKVMNILLNLRSLSEKTILIQTRNPENKIFDYALKGNISDFYKEEIAEREEVGYPPFNTFIKISLEGNKTVVRKKMEELKESFASWDISVFEAFHSGAYKKYTVNALIKTQKKNWPEPELLNKLRSLSPEFAIRIDPDSLL